MNKLSKDDEQKAMLALESAIQLANDGMTPSDAIVKAARDAQLEAPMVQRVVEAYNVSKTLHHFKKAAGAERGASFPIAIPEAIIATLFPPNPMTEQKEAAAAVHASHADFASFVLAKAASDNRIELPRMVEKPAAYERDPAYFVQKVIDERGKLIALHKQAADTARDLYWKMLGEIDKAANYFKRTTPGESFDLVEKRAYAEYGRRSVTLMDLIVQTGGLDDRRVNVKRAAADELGAQQMAFDAGSEPYCHIADAMLFSREIARISKEAAAISDTVDTHAITNTNLLPERDVLVAIDRQLQKRAGKDMPSFTDQDRPESVKKIYRALKRDHPEMPAEQKARIAAKQGKPGKQKQSKTPVSA